MPEMTFTVRWPDGSVVDCYSPSLVMHDHLAEGARYPLEEFVARSTEALDIASDRVRAKYGFACSSAMAQRDDIERMAAAQGRGDVTVLSMVPPLPAAAVPVDATPMDAVPATTVPVEGSVGASGGGRS